MNKVIKIIISALLGMVLVTITKDPFLSIFILLGGYGIYFLLKGFTTK